ncbi:MAG: SigE family RNA polymerase sigma factor [Actinomycetota bacterium]
MSSRAIAEERDAVLDTTSRVAALYALHAHRVGRLAYLLTGDPDLAEDLAHEAFAGLLSRFRTIRDEALVAAYLRRSVVNLVRKHWRKRGTERRYLRREGATIVARTTELPEPSVRDDVWEALQKLPYRQRAAIVLRFYEDLTERETARVLACAVGTVKSSVARGLERMREELIVDEDIRV